MRLDDLRPGWRTDFILHRHGAMIHERDDCIVVRTPDNPSYYWGNFLLLPTGPADADLAHWRERFRAEIGSLQPATLHEAFGVDAVPDGRPLPAWREAGFDIFETAVLQLEPAGLRAPARPPRGDLRFAALDLARDIEAIVALECADTHGFGAAGYADYRRRQLQHCAAMARDGQAAWFGVWCDGVLAADCGLIREKQGVGSGGPLGRFQRVATHPQYRRRGLCSALVHGVSAWGFQNWGLDRILMCADPDDVAIGIYESLGYRRMARDWALQRYAPQDEGARRPAPAPA